MKHIDKAVRFVKSAGAKTEADSDRDGFLSYHAESHAAGLGLAAGFAFAAWSEMSLLGIVYGAAVHGRVAQSAGKRRRILRDVVQEPHYALGGIVLGAVLGAAVRVAMARGALPML